MSKSMRFPTGTSRGPSMALPGGVAVLGTLAPRPLAPHWGVEAMAGTVLAKAGRTTSGGTGYYRTSGRHKEDKSEDRTPGKHHHGPWARPPPTMSPGCPSAVEGQPGLAPLQQPRESAIPWNARLLSVLLERVSHPSAQKRDNWSLSSICHIGDVTSRGLTGRAGLAGASSWQDTGGSPGQP